MAVFRFSLYCCIDSVVHVSQLVQCSTNFRVHCVYYFAEHCLKDVYKLFLVDLKVMRLRLILVDYQQVRLALVHQVAH